MSGVIKQLSSQVINLIAAGEVVERPSSIVRELVDNALDAGASEIRVELEEGGLVAVRVFDDGAGMGVDDAALAFERHATSKIEKASDLDAIATRGFRGEALASIAAVSKVVLDTQPKGARVGTRIRGEGGKFFPAEKISRTNGTTVESRALFFNTPARRKFLKTPRTEEQRVRDLLMGLALANPAVSFRLQCDGRELFSLPAKGSLRDRARTLFRGTVVEVAATRHSADGLPITVEGLLAHPGQAQVDSKALTLIVNSRVVQDRVLLRAVRDGFAGMLKEREVPYGVLSVTLDPRVVDVNVHPQKSEVRFRNSQEIFGAVQAAVRNAVQEFRGVQGAIAPDGPQPTRRSLYALPDSAVSQTVARYGVAESPPIAENSGYLPPTQTNFVSLLRGELRGPGVAAPVIDQVKLSEARWVGQVLGCYLLAELNGELIAVDMHAAHERIQYNRIRSAFLQKNIPSQELLVPHTVALTPRGAERVLEEEKILARIGIIVEGFGKDAIIVRAVPQFLTSAGLDDFIREIAATEEGEAESRFEERVTSLAARWACHASVRSGQLLSREEGEALFRELDRALTGGACPHGRPTVARFSAEAVERWFGRDR